MNAEEASDPIARLRELLSATTVVDPAIFPRLLRALVRSAGQEGEVALGLRLIREEDQRRAVDLIELSAGVLGDRAIAYLRAGASRWKGSAARMLATASALGQLATPEAHQILCAMETESPSPEVRRAATAQRERIEACHPTRYSLLSALASVSAEPAEADALARRLWETDDPELIPLLLDAWEGLAVAARTVVLRVLAVRGDSLAGHTLQGMIEADDAQGLLGPLCRCLSPIFSRHPEAVKGYDALWQRLWSEHAGTADIAEAAAVALSAAPAAEGVPLYREFLRSPHSGVRTAGLRALAAVPAPEVRPAVVKCLSSNDEEETAAALEVLAALGEDGAIRDWARHSEPAHRRGVARVCLRALGPDVWVDLVADSDLTVAEAALDAWDRTPPELRPNNRQVEPLLVRTGVVPVYRRVCRILAAIGDVETVGVAAGQLQSEPWKRVFIVRILKALRIRKVFHWRQLPEDVAVEILRVLEEQDDLETLSLLSILVGDLPESALARLGATLRKRYEDFGPIRCNAHEVAGVVLGRVLDAVSREQVGGEVDRLIEAACGPSSQFPAAVSTIARTWLRCGDTLGADRVSRVERFLCDVAEDRSRRHQERSEALSVLGARGSAEAMRTVAKFRAHPLEVLAASAAEGLAAYGRRNQTVDLAVLPASGDPAVLVVTDDERAQELYRSFFECRGYRVLAAAGVAGAVRSLRAPNVSVAIVDLDLRDGVGHEVLRAVAGRSAGPMVIALSNHADQASVLRLRSVGVSQFLRKPADPGALLARIRRAAGNPAKAPSQARPGAAAQGEPDPPRSAAPHG